MGRPDVIAASVLVAGAAATAAGVAVGLVAATIRQMFGRRR